MASKEYLFYVQDQTGREVVAKRVTVARVGEVVAEFGGGDTVHLIHKGDSVASASAPVDAELTFHRVPVKLAKPVSKPLKRAEE